MTLRKRAKIKIAACMSIIVAPLGISKTKDKYNPLIALNIPMITDKVVIRKKVLLMSFAAAGGTTRNAAIRIMPTNLIDMTIDTAIRIESK
jgi:hypothetical protein